MSKGLLLARKNGASGGYDAAKGQMRAMVGAFCGLFALLFCLGAGAQQRFPVTIGTNDVLLSGTNLFNANSNRLNAAVGGVNTNLSGIAFTSGTVTLTQGTNLVSTVWAQSTNRILVSYRSMNGSLAMCGVKNITNGVNMTVFSNNSSDTNSIDYIIVKP